MVTNDEILALADELDGVSIKDNCDACLASGTGLCRGDLECAESAHKACAKRLREIVEHDECEVTTVSAYDLLSDDDREALAWVREMGGIEGVKNRIAHAKPEPDTWKRIEEDATRMPGEYCERYGIYGDSFPQAEAMACDLVRRCRALAERGGR